MALKAIITKDEHGSLAEPLREHYTEGKDGTFTLGVTPVNGFDLQDIRGLNSALEKERQNVKDLNRKLADIGDLDPAAAREALKKLEDLKSGKLKSEDDAAFQAKVKELADKHQTELQGKDKRISTLTKKLADEMIESKAAVLMAKEGIKGNPTLLMPHVLREARVEADGEDFRTTIVDPSTGVERMSLLKDRAGKSMDLEELLQDMKGRKDLQGAFYGPGSSGTGGESVHGPAGSQGGGHVISAAEAKDVGKYRAAKAAAEKAGQPLEIAPG